MVVIGLMVLRALQQAREGESTGYVDDSYVVTIIV